MPKMKSYWLKPNKQFVGQKPGLALVKWLNDPQPSPKFVEDLLSHARVVFETTAHFRSPRELIAAWKKKKVPDHFWTSHEKLNETLSKLTYAPKIELHELPNGERVSWTLVTKERPMELFSIQVRWLLQLIEQGAILKVRRCKECQSWFFAQFSHRAFCSKQCQMKHFAGSDKFKQKRREYMRDYNKLQKSGKFK